MISPYDVYFKQYGEKFEIDWRLLASIAYQESTFNPEGGLGQCQWLNGVDAGHRSVNGSGIGGAVNTGENIGTGAEYLRELLDVFTRLTV